MLASIRSSLLRQTRVASRPPAASPMSTASNPNAPAQPREPLKDMAGLTDLLGNIPDQVQAPESTKRWRIFYSGDIVNPTDLTPARCLNQRRGPRRIPVPPPAPEARYNDIFRQLNLDPVDFALNPAVLSAYVSEMGKIYGRNITGLTSRSQRRLGKAIRRARMIGVLPQLSRPSKLWVSNVYRRRS